MSTYLDDIDFCIDSSRRYNGEDSENGIKLSWTDFSRNEPQTEVLGTNLSMDELRYMLSRVMRQGSKGYSNFGDVPFPGEPGMVGITLERVKDYEGNDVEIPWTNVGARHIDLRQGRSFDLPLIEERYHHSTTCTENSVGRGQVSGEVTIRRSTMWFLRQAAENLSTNGRGYREQGTVGVRFWLAPDGWDTLSILQLEYPELETGLEAAFKPQYLH